MKLNINNDVTYIKKHITSKHIADFTIKCLEEYSDLSKLNDAFDVCNTMIKLFDFYKLDYKSNPGPMYDTLFSAAILHNLFFDSHNYLKEKKNNKTCDWTKLFSARYLLIDIAKEYLSTQEANAIFSCIEAQLGKETPISMLIPNIGTPTDTFTLAIYLSKEMFN